MCRLMARGRTLPVACVHGGRALPVACMHAIVLHALHTINSQTILGCRYIEMVKHINEQEPQLQKLTDQELKGKTVDFRERLRQGEPLDDLLVEAFAVVREVSSRVLRLRHFDAQLVSCCRYCFSVLHAVGCLCWCQQLIAQQCQSTSHDGQSYAMHGHASSCACTCLIAS